MSGLLRDAVVVIKRLYDLAKLARVNRKLCARLAERCHLLHASLDRIQTVLDSQPSTAFLKNMELILTSLLTFLRQCESLLNEHTKTKWWRVVIRVLRAGAIKNELTDLNMALTDHMQNLQLALQAASFQPLQEAPKVDEELDVAEAECEDLALAHTQLGLLNVDDAVDKKLINEAKVAVQLRLIESRATMQRLKSRQGLGAAANESKEHSKEELESWFNVAPENIERGRQIGKGGMGSVFLCKYAGFACVLKELRGVSDDMLRVVRKELSIMRSLPCPNIPRVFGGQFAIEPYCILLEHCERGDLCRLLAQSPNSLSKTQSLTILRDVAVALSFLHSQQIVHRDLKSPNVLVRANWSACVSDFGLAKLKNELASRGTAIVGTSGWLPPEAYDGKYSFASDVYAFGIIMWEVATCQLPWAGCTPMKIMSEVARGIRPDRQAPVDTKKFGDWYVNLMQRCWSQDASDRPTSAEVLSTITTHGGFESQHTVDTVPSIATTSPLSAVVPSHSPPVPARLSRVPPSDLSADVVETKESRVVGPSPIISWKYSRSFGRGHLECPNGMSYSAHHKLIFVADELKHSVFVFQRDGSFVSRIGSEGSGDGQLSYPRAPAVYENELFVADWVNSRIVVFHIDGRFLRSWGSEGSSAGQFRGPSRVFVSRNGSVFVSDSGNRRVQIFRRDGSFVRQFGHGQLGNPYGLVISNGEIFTCDYEIGRVLVFRESDFMFLRQIGSNGSLSHPNHIFVSADGCVYVSESTRHRISVFDASGQPLYVIGSGSASGAHGEFNGPRAVLLIDEELLIVDYSNSRVQVFNSKQDAAKRLPPAAASADSNETTTDDAAGVKPSVPGQNDKCCVQ